MDYIDASTGQTLVAVPGESYSVAVASGRHPEMPEMPADGRWETAAPPEPPARRKSAGKDAAPVASAEEN
jgi:hypothetical protein